jgi:hypothetical protein
MAGGPRRARSGHSLREPARERHDRTRAQHRTGTIAVPDRTCPLRITGPAQIAVRLAAEAGLTPAADHRPCSWKSFHPGPLAS